MKALTNTLAGRDDEIKKLKAELEKERESHREK